MSSLIIDGDHTDKRSSTSSTETRPVINSNQSSRHHANLGEQSSVPHPVEVRLAQSGRRQNTTAHLVRRSLVACDGDGSFGEQQASQSVHAAVVSHAAHHTLWVAWVGDISVGDGTPFDVFFTGFPGKLSVHGSGKLNDQKTHSLLGPSPGWVTRRCRSQRTGGRMSAKKPNMSPKWRARPCRRPLARM
jgi:hypothetical protein